MSEPRTQRSELRSADDRQVGRTWSGAIAVLLTVAMIGGGCGRDEDSTDCAFWADKLARSGKIEMSLTKVGELKCKEAIPVLKALFDQGLLRMSVLQTIREIGDATGGAPVVRSALLVPDTSRLAAQMVREWKLSAAVPELTKVLRDPKLMEARDAAFDALLELGDPKEHEDLLIELALADPNKQPVAINKRSIEELGKIGSKKAVPTLVKAIFLRSMRGQEVFTMTREALAAVGDASVIDELLGVVKGTNQEVLTYTRELGLEPWELDATPKTVQILADTLDPKVVEPLIHELKKDIVPPEEISDNAYDRWSMDKTNRLKVITFALGHIGVETGLADLGALLMDGMKDTVNQRINAANALAYIGTEAAQDLLLKAWDEERVIVLRAALLQTVAMGLDDRRLARWDELLGIVPEGERPPKKPPELSEAVKNALANNERIVGYIGAIRECMDKLPCWLKKTKSEDQDQQIKALMVLGRGRFGVSDEIKKALWDAFESADKPMVDTKRFALMGLTRLGNQADGQRMADKGRELMEDDPYWGGELFGYGNGLKRRMLR